MAAVWGGEMKKDSVTELVAEILGLEVEEILPDFRIGGYP